MVQTTVMTDRRVIRGATVVALDGRRVLRKSDILMKDGVIAAIGGVDTEGAMITEVQGVVMPGLAQAHAHLDQTLLDRHFVADTDPSKFRHTQLPAYLAQLAGEETSMIAEAAFARGLRTGTTLFADTGKRGGRRVAIDAALKLGVRLVAPLDVSDGGPIERDIDVLAAELETGGASSLVKLALWAGDAERTPLSVLREAARVSMSRGLPLIVHLGALPGDEAGVRRLDRAQALHKHLVCVHGTGRSLASEKNLSLLEQAQASLLLTPAFDLLMGAPSPSLDRLIASKLNIGLASESGATRTRLDLFREVRLLYHWLVGRVQQPASLALEIAAKGGATAMGFGAGSITVGQPADLLLIDVEAEPTDDHELVARRIIVQGESSVVRKVWIRGQVAYAEGRVTKADPPGEEDEEALRARLGFAMENLTKKRGGMTQQIADRVTARLRLALGWHEGRLPFLPQSHTPPAVVLPPRSLSSSAQASSSASQRPAVRRGSTS